MASGGWSNPPGCSPPRNSARGSAPPSTVPRRPCWVCRTRSRLIPLFPNRLPDPAVWISEHHFVDDGSTPSPLVLASAIAARTSTMRIGTAVLLLPLHDPVRVAEDAASVDLVSNGRFDLGVGLGYARFEFEGFGVPYAERAGRLDEGVQILQRLFAGERFAFEGKYLRRGEIALYP